MNILALCTVALFAIMCGSARAETVDHYINQLTRHPSVTDMLERRDSFENLSRSALSLPDPQLIVGVDNIPLSNPSFNRFLPSSKILGFRQSIPNPAVRQRKSNLQKVLSGKQELMAEYQIQRLVALFMRQLTEIDKVRKLELLLKEKLDLYQLMENDLQGQLEAGKSVYGLFSEIDVERSDIEQQLNALQAERVEIQEILIELVETVPELSPPKISVLKWIRNETPLYPTLIAHEAVAVSKKRIGIAEAEFKPNYGLQAIYKQRESSDTFKGDDWFSIQANISIPIWSKSNQAPKLASAKAMMRSAQSAYEQSVRHWNQRMASLNAEQKYALENINLFKKKKRALKEMIAAAERNYESGNTALRNVLDAQINYLSIAAKLVSQESRYKNLIVEFNSHIQAGKEKSGGSHVGL